MTKYYVATAYESACFMPVIMQAFDSKDNANEYAKLVSATHKKVILLQLVEDNSRVTVEEQNKTKGHGTTWFGRLIDKIFY